MSLTTTRVLPLSLACALLVLAAPPGSVAQGADDPLITIQGFAFSPNRLEVDAGATVSVVNRDSAPHSVKHPRFDSGVLDRDETATFTAPAEAGEYAYQCGIHASMRGVLVVRAAAPATTTPATTTPTPSSPEPTTRASSTPASPGPTTPVSPTSSTPAASTPPAATTTPEGAPATTTPAAGASSGDVDTSAGNESPGFAVLTVALGTAAAVLLVRRRT